MKRAFTLMELILSMALISIVIPLIFFPFFYFYKLWDQSMRDHERLISSLNAITEIENAWQKENLTVTPLNPFILKVSQIKNSVQLDEFYTLTVTQNPAQLIKRIAQNNVLQPGMQILIPSVNALSYFSISSPNQILQGEISIQIQNQALWLPIYAKKNL